VRISRVRRTDYRPSGAGASSPLEREFKPRPRAVASPDVWDRFNGDTQAEAAEHDKWVADLSIAVVEAIAADLGKLKAWNKRSYEHRWIMGRKAAVLRRLLVEREKLSKDARSHVGVVQDSPAGAGRNFPRRTAG